MQTVYGAHCIRIYMHLFANKYLYNCCGVDSAGPHVTFMFLQSRSSWTTEKVKNPLKRRLKLTDKLNVFILIRNNEQ